MWGPVRRGRKRADSSVPEGGRQSQQSACPAQPKPVPPPPPSKTLLKKHTMPQTQLFFRSLRFMSETYL